MAVFRQSVVGSRQQAVVVRDLFVISRSLFGGHSFLFLRFLTYFLPNVRSFVRFMRFVSFLARGNDHLLTSLTATTVWDRQFVFLGYKIYRGHGQVVRRVSVSHPQGITFQVFDRNASVRPLRAYVLGRQDGLLRQRYLRVPFQLLTEGREERGGACSRGR